MWGLPNQWRSPRGQLRRSVLTRMSNDGECGEFDEGSAPRQLGVEMVDIAAFYGQAQALFGVSIAARKGQITAVFGHNGAGKSTLLRCVAGLHKQYTGSISILGVASSGRRPHEVAKSGAYLVREGSRVFDLMTVNEHLALASRQGKKAAPKDFKGAWSPEAVYEAIPLLQRFRNQQGGLLSGGQRQALGLGMALAFEPKVLLIDEPSTGLAPAVAEDIYQIIAEIANSGVTLVVAEQEPQWLTGLASTQYVMDVGRVVDEASLSS